MRVFIQHSDWSHEPQLGFSKSNFGTSLGLNFNLKPLDIFDSLGPYPQFGILEIIATSSGLGLQPQLGLWVFLLRWDLTLNLVFSK